MKATEILSNEHQHILQVIELITKKCDELESGQDLDKVFFEMMIDFIRNYADKFHHAKEEDILFVEMQKNQDAMHCNPIEQMLYEHNLGRGFVARAEDGLKTNNKSKILENMRGYTALLRDHIFKEDNILYPMINETLDEESQKLILEKFEQVDKSLNVEKWSKLWRK